MFCQYCLPLKQKSVADIHIKAVFACCNYSSCSYQSFKAYCIISESDGGQYPHSSFCGVNFIQNTVQRPDTVQGIMGHHKQHTTNQRQNVSVH